MFTTRSYCVCSLLAPAAYVHCETLDGQSAVEKVVFELHSIYKHLEESLLRAYTQMHMDTYEYVNKCTFALGIYSPIHVHVPANYGLATRSKPK
ncbi:hypothetical protein POVWA2_012280 [Plasmodium ovale wallikeri]|uniref:PIR Superfamily Protein n=1 Tax=Plasmodium ovale wallikeri TaxID=864142 RepID=A0A1A8YNI4_PLAOA|nr:hypothetical protein POVWA1_011580 [Plasmodium ovale wallikeri]SBT32957.1 hypothetical protein POVWA2_012280 [Plasmodium ovale wallikeri]